MNQLAEMSGASDKSSAPIGAAIDRLFTAYLAEVHRHSTLTYARGRRQDLARSGDRLNDIEAEVRNLAAGGVSPAELAVPILFELFWSAAREVPLRDCGDVADFLLSLLYRLQAHLEGCLREIVDDVLRDERRTIGETLLWRGRPADPGELEGAA